MSLCVVIGAYMALFEGGWFFKGLGFFGANFAAYGMGVINGEKAERKHFLSSKHAGRIVNDDEHLRLP
jgi:hypothetical protein